jgi:ATP-binding cassette subfamily G (WHITE) protein 2
VVHRHAGLASFLHHYTVLVRREWLAATRNPADAAGRLVTITGVALLSGLAFYSLSSSGDSFQMRLNSMSWELFALATL